MRFLRQPLLNTLATAAISMILLTSAFADVDIATIKKFDLNGDGLINPGTEVELLGTKFSRLSSVQKGHYQVAVLNTDPASGVPVSDFNTQKWFEDLKLACNPGQRFFLRDRVINSSILQPNLEKVAGGQAVISATRLNETDTWQWNSNGAITAVPVWNPCLVDEDWSDNELVLSGAALAPFVEVSGSGRTGQPSVSSLRFGANAELQLFSGSLFDVQQINVMPFYQTDLDFDAEIYGVTASWQPISNQLHLGSYLGTPQKLEAWWTLLAKADFLTVQKPGRTNYQAGTQHGGLSLEIGAHLKYAYSDELPTLFLDASHTFRRDVVNGGEADLFKLDAGVFLDPAQNTSISLSYQNGTDEKTLNKLDQVTLQLGVKF